MAKRWAAWAAILVLAATLPPSSVPRNIAQAQLAPDSWQTYEDVIFGYTIAYPAGWEPQIAFENPPGQPHIIRERIAFHSPQQAQVEIDVWDRDPTTSTDQWFSQVEHITTTIEINALISGQDAYLRVQPGGCGVPDLYTAYIPFADRVYKISHPSNGDLASLSAYDGMLRSFALHAVDPTTRAQTSLPDYLPSTPLTCSTNVCPSTCWGECTFAAISEGCCGYHPVPKWQCAKECVGDQPGDFQGNCVWWGAYTRPDVGELASGNAEYWADTVRNTGQLPIDSTPKVGDIVVHPGTSWNHVAYVVWVSDDGNSYLKSDMGWCGDCDPTPDEYDLHTVDDDDEFIHCAGDPAIPTVDWQFTDCPFGWTPSKGFAASALGVELEGYYAWGFDPAAHPFLLSPILDVPADDYLHIMVRIFSHAADTTGTIYFATVSSPGFDEDKSVDFAVTNDGAWHDIIVDMGSNPNWQGTITRLRVDPIGNGNADGSYDGIGIGRIRILPIDTTPPELAVNVQPDGWTGPFTGDSSPQFHWDAANDDPEGWGMAGYHVAVDDWTPDGNCTADWWAGDAVSFAPPLEIAQGEHIFAVTSEDLAGNANPADTDLPGDAPYYGFTVDLIGPSAPEIALGGPGCDAIQNNGWQNTCYDPAFWWSAADDLSGVADYLLYWGDRSDGTPNTQTGDTALLPGAIAPVDGAASAYLHVVARDLVEHTSGRSTFALRYDGAAPTAGVVIDGDAPVATQLQVTITLSAQDIGSGITGYRLSNDGTDWTEWQSWTGEGAAALDIPWELPEVDESEHTVYARVRDQASNESAVTTDSIWLDLDASTSFSSHPTQHEAASVLTPDAQPTTFGLLINGGEQFALSRLVTVEAWAPHVNQVRLSNDAAFLDDGWTDYGTAMPWTLSDSGSPVRPRRVYAWFRDEQGLVYGPYLDEILYDAAPPRGGVVIPDSDPSTLKLWAWDGVSGIVQMRVGVEPTLTDASWQPFATSLAWQGGGPVAYAQFIDVAGNISRVFSSDEGLCPMEHAYLPLVLRSVGSGEDNQPPYEPADPWPPDAAIDQLPPLLLTWTGGDPDEEEVTYDVYLDPGDVAPLTPVCEDLASPACTPGTLLENTSYTWQVLATDARGASTLGPAWGLHTAPAGCVDVVTNGGFEIDSAWVLPSTPYPARYSTSQARNGSRSMQVGIVDAAEDIYSYSSASQVVTIPNDAASAILRFWLYTTSDEPDAGTSTVPVLGPLALLAEDAQYVIVFSEDGTTLRRRSWQPPLDNRAWTEHSIDLSAFAGRTVNLYFGVSNDGDGEPTVMYVDEVTLVACPP